MIPQLKTKPAKKEENKIKEKTEAHKWKRNKGKRKRDSARQNNRWQCEVNQV
jgi:hypothetical protein